MVAGLPENSHTCPEVAFLRISQFFENSLSQRRWHGDLLEKARVHIDAVRIAAISERRSAGLVKPLQRRRSKRLAFGLEHDWDRLDLLCRKLKEYQPAVQTGLDGFSRSWRELEGPRGSPQSHR
jgi:hypothetical protein